MKIVITGVAGFIGSHLLTALLTDPENEIIGVDNLSTGQQENIYEAIQAAGESISTKRFLLYQDDICNFQDYPRDSIVFHLAAIGSVPKSIEYPFQTHRTNTHGFFQALNYARLAKVKRFIYASSSSVYGSSIEPINIETLIGYPLSPYAASKQINELYANTFTRTYGMETIGVRFFNVYGPRQNSNGDYAAVIPKWINQFVTNQPIIIHGDGNQSRDFTYVLDAVKGLLLSAKAKASGIQINIGTGQTTKLFELYGTIKELIPNSKSKLTYTEARLGDKLNSLADLALANKILNYYPNFTLKEGLGEFVNYVTRHSSSE